MTPSVRSFKINVGLSGGDSVLNHFVLHRNSATYGGRQRQSFKMSYNIFLPCYFVDLIFSTLILSAICGLSFPASLLLPVALSLSLTDTHEKAVDQINVADFHEHWNFTFFFIKFKIRCCFLSCFVVVVFRSEYDLERNMHNIRVDS